MHNEPDSSCTLFTESEKRHQLSPPPPPGHHPRRCPLTNSMHVPCNVSDNDHPPKDSKTKHGLDSQPLPKHSNDSGQGTSEATIFDSTQTHGEHRWGNIKITLPPLLQLSNRPCQPTYSPSRHGTNASCLTMNKTPRILTFGERFVRDDESPSPPTAVFSLWQEHLDGRSQRHNTQFYFMDQVPSTAQ